MPLRGIKVRYVGRIANRLHQGDIYRDLDVLERVESPDVAGQANLEVVTRHLPYVVILTQDCDLEQDHLTRADTTRKNQDKFLLTILVCPGYPAALLREGKHLGDDHPMQKIMGSDAWRHLKTNQNVRYHFLDTDPDLQVPELVLDFKQYFTLPRDQMYGPTFAPNYVATANAVFREDLCRRFADYLTRIALPEIMAAGPPGPIAAAQGGGA